jgi:hypothetical protein
MLDFTNPHTKERSTGLQPVDLSKQGPSGNKPSDRLYHNGQADWVIS